ncbi:transcriptional regulator [Enterococcus entomosocium]|uniref:transcriptional regulator n=1 Tax=Enterococcus entomosocium TaxID=3034352 RepID=UPI003D6B485D
MRLFDVHQFELPEKEVIDWEKTKGEIGSMLSSYLVSRERMGLTRMPPIHSTYSLLDQDIPEIKHSSFVQENQQFKQEFLYFHHLFSLGLTAISHPYKPEITDRIHYQKNVIVDDSQSGLLQFANALSILALKEQEISA